MGLSSQVRRKVNLWLGWVGGGSFVDVGGGGVLGG